MLAYLALHAVQPGLDGTTFDSLQLRSALAEIFSSLELYGDDAWRAAARVRLLLVYGDRPLTALLGDRAFWHDGDVVWLAGVHDAGGTTYLNKESFEALLCWLALPALLDLSRAGGSAPSIEAIEETVTTASRSAAESGYTVPRLLALLSTPPSAPARNASTPAPNAAAKPSVEAATEPEDLVSTGAGSPAAARKATPNIPAKGSGKKRK